MSLNCNYGFSSLQCYGKTHYNNNILLCLQNETVDGALTKLNGDGVTQPMVFRIDTDFYLKVDNTAIPLSNCSCFVEAIELCFASFFTFNVNYPNEIRHLYIFLEHLLNIRHSKRSTIVVQLFRHLDYHVARAVAEDCDSDTL